MLYWEYYLMGIVLLPGIILSIWAEIKVSSTFAKYSKVLGAKNLTGAEVAQKILSHNNLSNVAVRRVSGELTDNYNSRTNVVSLSDSVYDSPTISALGVAAHECGHAIQYANNYGPIKFRKFVGVMSNISSKLLWPLIIVGLILGIGVNSPYGNIMLWSGIIFFGLSALFSLITLPVELNASKRALKALVEVDALDEMEVIGAKKVLNAAALTYVAALVMSMLELLRFILVFAKRDD